MLVEQLIQNLQNLTKQKITQKDLGDALGISKQAIGNKKDLSENKPLKYLFRTYILTAQIRQVKLGYGKMEERKCKI